MKKYLFIAVGGMAGAILRFSLSNIHLFQNEELNVLITLFINVSGSFVLAFLLTLTEAKLPITNDAKAGISVGFLGAYTTFSTFCKEVMHFIQTGKYFEAGIYMFASICLGLIAIYCGILLGKKVDLQFHK